MSSSRINLALLVCLGLSFSSAGGVAAAWWTQQGMDSFYSQATATRTWTPPRVVEPAPAETVVATPSISALPASYLRDQPTVSYLPDTADDDRWERKMDAEARRWQAQIDADAQREQRLGGNEVTVTRGSQPTAPILQEATPSQGDGPPAPTEVVSAQPEPTT